MYRCFRTGVRIPPPPPYISIMHPLWVFFYILQFASVGEVLFFNPEELQTVNIKLWLLPKPGRSHSFIWRHWIS